MNTEHDNTLLSILGKITDSLLLCLLYLLSCLPVITIGAATTALYYTTHKVLRCDRSYLWKEYKRAWKENQWLHGPPMKYIVEHVRRGLSDGFGRIKNRGGALG